MTPLSPLDALGPAFRRTREVLAGPFRLGFFLKIALVAALTQPGFYSASISYPFQGVQFAALRGLGHRSGLPGYGGRFMGAPGLAAFGVFAVLGVIVIGLALWVLMAYLYCRLRFTLFDLVVYKRGRVGQAWSGYGRQSWRYFGLVVLVGLAFLVVAAVLVGPAALHLVRVMGPLAGSGRNLNPFPLLGAMLPLLAAIFAVAALWAGVDALMQDFLVPPMAIEDAPIESALGRFFALLRQSPGQVVVYVLLRFAVGIGLVWILLLVLFAGLLVAGMAIYGVGMLLYRGLWTSLVGQVVCVALAIVVGLVVLAIYAAAMVSIYGIAAVFKQSYAACFFGGRYPELGERLEPTPATSTSEFFEPPPPPPSPAPELPPAGLPPWSGAPPVW